jgi:hypothetical protein
MRLIFCFALAALVAFPVVQAVLSGRARIAGMNISKAKNPFVFWSSMMLGAGIALAIVVVGFARNQ